MTKILYWPKECPFCGNVDQEKLQVAADSITCLARVYCLVCQAAGPPALLASDKEAIRLWNERVDD